MDLTKCTSINCPYRNTCYRQIEEDRDNPDQSYCNFEYYCMAEGDGFSYYIKGDD